MGMNALHVLVCNPPANADFIQMVTTLDPTMSTMINRHGTTPIDLFLQLQDIDVENSVSSLDNVIQNGMCWSDAQTSCFK